MLSVSWLQRCFWKIRLIFEEKVYPTARKYTKFLDYDLSSMPQTSRAALGGEPRHGRRASVRQLSSKVTASFRWFGDGCPPTKHYPCVPTAGYTLGSIIWQIVPKGRPILMGRKSPTRVGTKKSQGRDKTIPTWGRNKTSEEWNETSEEWNDKSEEFFLPHVESKE